MTRSLVVLVPLALAAPAFAQTVLYETSFDDLGGWTVTAVPPSFGYDVRWDVDAAPVDVLVPYRSAPASLNFNDDDEGIPWGRWTGHVDSPAIDLSVATGPVTLTFWYAMRHEWGCEWDALHVTVLDASTGEFRYDECISFPDFAYGTWIPHAVPLDPAWGEIRVRFSHDSLDDWNFGLTDQGSFIDDLAIVAECAGATVLCTGSGTALDAVLSVSGTSSLGAANLTLRGEGFPSNSFAAAFAGPAIGTITVGIGTRCISGAGSVRLPVAPTRDFGRPVWMLDLSAEPLAPIAIIGQPLYVQTIFRDGALVNASVAIELVPCQ
ncbi:MAG: hypothetical protein AAF726_20340 [Planctomycetota bacterium]